MRALLLLCLLLLATLAHAAPPLRLAAAVTRSDYVAGDRFSIDAHLFNDSDAPIAGSITIVAPAGFALLTADSVAGDIAPGGVLSLTSSYRVTPTAPKGRATFVVRGGGLEQRIVIRIGPIESPPPRPPIYRVWFPVFLEIF